MRSRRIGQRITLLDIDLDLAPLHQIEQFGCRFFEARIAARHASRALAG